MELVNDFRVSTTPAETWKVLTDVERIAPLLPGAQLQEIEGDEYRGIVKVKVGPITAQYKGTATFVERDEAAGRMVLRASGRDTRGQGNASATITATMAPDGDGTAVSVVTDLTITGKVAQFGRGVLADVSGKLVGQFVDALEADLASGAPSAAPDEPPAAAPNGPPIQAEAPAEPAGTAAASRESVAAAEGASSEVAAKAPAAAAPSGPRQINAPEAQPVDLLDAAGGSVLKRLGPVLGAAAGLLVLLAWRRRRHR